MKILFYINLKRFRYFFVYNVVKHNLDLIKHDWQIFLYLVLATSKEKNKSYILCSPLL